MNTTMGFGSALAVAVSIAALAPPAPAAASGDVLVQVLSAGGAGVDPTSYISRMAMPRGPHLGMLRVDKDVLQVTALANGNLAAIVRGPFTPFDPTPRLELWQIAPDGSKTRQGEIEPPGNQQGHADALGLATDDAERLFLLTRIPTQAFPPASYLRLARLDPETGATLEALVLEEPASDILRAPKGLWAYDGATETIRRLDPDTGRTYGRALASGPVQDVDSSGALWRAFDIGICSPPCMELSRFDPDTGSRYVVAPQPPLSVAFSDVAIERHCDENATTRCLLGGRFRAEVTWKDPQGVVGAGRSASARSPDTGIFYFFEPANWELQIKVLDGCALNGHYWVFAAASTNVEYRLKVTDLLTGDFQLYDNPLGHKAEAVDDTAAFPCGNEGTP